MANGSLGGVTLDGTNATVTLTRAQSVVSSALAEISPPRVVMGQGDRVFSYSVSAVVGAGDVGFTELEITIPPGFVDVVVLDVSIDGTTLAATCPTPGAGEFCGVAAGSTLTVAFGGPPVIGSPSVVVRFRADIPPVETTVDFPSRLVQGSLSFAVIPGDADGDPSTSNVTTVGLFPSQGIVLELDVLSDRETMILGEIVKWTVPVWSTVAVPVDSVKVDVSIPPHFKYLEGTTIMDGAPASDPTGVNTLVFNLGTIAPRDDLNGDGVLEPGEPGYRSISFVTVAGAGVPPGVHLAEGVARDYCPDCFISEPASATVRLLEDPDFYLGTLIGKVFRDTNEDGKQDPDELGVALARVVLDDGTVATTDEYGRFHIPQIEPGQRLVKLDVDAIAPRTRVVGDVSRIVRVSPGLMAKVTFPIVSETETAYLGRSDVKGIALVSVADDHGIEILGNVNTLSLLINGLEVPAPTVDVRMGRAFSMVGLTLKTKTLADRVDLHRVDAEDPARFRPELGDTEGIRSWTLTVADPNGAVLRRISGTGSPPAEIEWDGAPDPGVTLEAGVVANYQLALTLEGGDEVASPRHLLGIVRSVPSRLAGGRGKPVDVADSDLLRQYRGAPRIEVGGQPLEADDRGRFQTRVPNPEDDALSIRIVDASGRSVARDVPVPLIEIAERESRRVVAFGTAPGLLGWTAPSNSVTIDGNPVQLREDGAIVVENADSTASTTHAVLVQNPQGFSRIVNLHVDRSEFDESGSRWVVDAAVPFLEVNLPPAGVPLESPVFQVFGRTMPGHRVFVDGTEVPVLEDGVFSGAVPLDPGATQVEIAVEDSTGRRGQFVRELEVAPAQRLFLLAFADGEIGQLHASGRLDATGQDDADEFYHQARLAYFLRGTIRGRWLVESAFDTGRGELDELFDNLGPDETDFLIRNLDPDKHYSVYGDASTAEYSETLGKFYLAISDDEIGALVGNFPVAFEDTELAAYRRTLYGGVLSYRTLDVTSSGSPVTNIVVFGADAGRVHVRNEFVATGGSLYYLSRENAVEGSEQVTLVVRDKNTGLVLRRDPQRRGIDYTVKYEEGRLHFRRPISSTVLDGSPIDQGLLAGHPVEIEVDFEARSIAFEENAAGVRAHQWIGDHAAIGGTYVDDPQAAGSYEMKAVDGELRYGDSRIVAEWVETEGSDARSFRSVNGGLSFEEVSTPVDQGEAWKVAAELDAGAWLGHPGRLRIGGYHTEIGDGFASGMRSLDRGVLRTGANVRVEVTDSQAISARHHIEEHEAGGAVAGVPVETRLSALLWELKRPRWDATAEYQDRETEGGLVDSLATGRTAAARLTARLTAALSATIERQQTFSGLANDQTTVGVRYELREGISLDVEGTEGELGRSARGGAVVEFGGSRLYAREQMFEDAAGDRTSTVLGAESAIGRSSRVYTEYQWDRSDQGDRTISLVGMQRTWEPQEGLKIVLGGEFSDLEVGGLLSERSAATGAISWANRAGITVSSRNEIRYQTGTEKLRQFLTANRLELSLTPSFTFLGRLRVSRTEDRETGATEAAFDEGSVGIAYRPIRGDGFQGIAKYTHLRDRRPPIADLIQPDRTMDVVAVEGVVDLTSRLQWYSKGAARILEEGPASGLSIRTRTYLGIQRFDYAVHAPYNLGLEYRMLHQLEANDTLAGWLAEATRNFGARIRLGAGFNFTDFSDDEFSMNDHTVSGWFIRVQGKY